MKVTRLVVLAQVLCVTASGAQSVVNGRPSLVLKGKTAQVVVDIGGGSIADFHLLSQGLNPLRWEEQGAPTAPRPMGHFLCLDRWGPPSEAEQKNGMPFHGEAARVQWDVLVQPESSERGVQAQMAATLPMAGLRIKRRIELSGTEAVFFVKEEVTNLNKLGRVFNMVQHPTIGPPFLDENTVVDANARRGFMQSSPLPDPEKPAVHWPEARRGGQPVDLRRLTNDHNPNVVSFTIDEEVGWVTACNPARGLLIGYIWKPAEYPWFNAWRHVENGKPAARGLEFGTTGLHQPFPVLVAKGKIFGRSIYEYLDANATVSKSYACFLFAIPKDYAGVARVTYRNGRLTLHERGAGPRRDLSMNVGKAL
jgi:hypothetical protein